jgi:hypothetical protein
VRLPVINLPARQWAVLSWIIEYADLHNGVTPGFRETARQFNIHPSTARGYIFELANKHLLRIVDKKIVVEDSEWTPPPYVD